MLPAPQSPIVLVQDEAAHDQDTVRIVQIRQRDVFATPGFARLRNLHFVSLDYPVSAGV